MKKGIPVNSIHLRFKNDFKRLLDSEVFRPEINLNRCLPLTSNFMRSCVLFCNFTEKFPCYATEKKKYIYQIFSVSLSLFLARCHYGRSFQLLIILACHVQQLPAGNDWFLKPRRGATPNPNFFENLLGVQRPDGERLSQITVLIKSESSLCKFTVPIILS